MNIEAAKKIVELATDDEIIHYYSEYISLCGQSKDNYIKRNEVSGSIPKNTLHHIVLDAFSIVKGYKVSKWVYSDKIKLSDIYDGEKPIRIIYRKKDGTISKEEFIYNIEQLKKIQIPLSKNIKYRKIDNDLHYIKVSGGYSGLNPNFVYTKLNQQEQLSEEFSNCIKILKNLIFRGCPTRPFVTLRKHLKMFDENYDFCQKPFYYFNIQQKLNWDGVIKGGAKDGLAYNPALTFYKMLNERFPIEGRTFLPECSFIDIVNDDSFSKESSIDFYSPFFKIVAEVDGSQHKDKIQKQKDEYRDSKLANCLIKVIRFDAGCNLSEPIEKIERLLNRNKEMRSIREPSQVELLSAILFRFQIALIEIIEKGWLNNQSIFVKLHDDIAINQTDLDIAYQDIKTTLLHLGALAKKTFNLPEFEFILVDKFEDNNELKIDISVLDLYDQTFIQEENKRQITIRTDYFPYIDIQGFDSSSEKNYYFVESSDFRFKNVEYKPTKKSKQHNALVYFLQNLFDFEDFRPKQEEIICKALNPNNGVIGLLPTGSGKSVCFQLVSLLTPGISLVISPLKSLMNDQCCNLRDRHGITNAYQISADHRNNLFLFLMGNTKLLYISPERFFNNDFRSTLIENKDKIAQIVVDEVHCLSEWGHEFRTSYLLLFNILKNAKFSNNLLVMGTSATASVRVTKDISTEFRKLGKVEELISSDTVSRPELIFVKEEIELSENAKGNKLIQIVKKAFAKNEKTIVFVPFRKNTNEIKSAIDRDVKLAEIEHTIRTETFVGGDDIEKVEKFKNNELDVIIATKAFGMGLDVPDIRHTVHYALSASIESIYQEMGRAGRDGKTAICHILFNDSGYKFKENPCGNNNTLEEIKKDVKKYDVLSPQLFFISNEFTPEEEKDFIIKLRKFLQTAEVKSKGGTFTLEKAKNFISPEEFNFQNIFEKALYRLYTLGIVDLWDIDYSLGVDNPTYSGLIENERTFADVLGAFNRYINQYDLSKLYTSKELSSIDDIIEELSKWIYDHFFIYRWTSLKTLYEWLKEQYKTDKEFSDNLSSHFNNYFSKNEDLDIILKENPTDYNDLYKCLTSSAAVVLNDQILNKIKEDENNFALNLLSGLVRLRLNSFENYDGESRLEMVLKIIENGSYRYAGKIYNFDNKYISDLMNMICVYLTDMEKIQFFIFLYEKFRNFYDLDIIQKNIVDMNSTCKHILFNLIKYKKVISFLEKIKNTLESKDERR